MGVFLEGDERHFGEVERILYEGPDPYDLDVDAYEERVGGVFEVCLTALEELDAKGFFVLGEERGASSSTCSRATRATRRCWNGPGG